MESRTIEAVVQTASAETEYRRAGNGRPVLLLVAGGTDGTMGRRLFERLAESARVFAPCAEPDGSRICCEPGKPWVDAAAWLGDLIDGLGLDRPDIVADAAFAAAAAAFRLADAERAGRVIILAGDDAADPASLLLDPPGP